jgi:hypothetical protein
MGLKGYRLWGMGQRDSTCRAPTALKYPTHLSVHCTTRRTLSLSSIDSVRKLTKLKSSTSSHSPRVVALQVASERQTLKPGFHLIGYMLWV